MDAYKTSIPCDDVHVGQGVSTETPSQLPKWVAYHGVTIKADKLNENTLYVGKHNVDVENNYFPLDAGEEVTISVDDPSKIWIVGVGNYSYLVQ